MLRFLLAGAGTARGCGVGSMLLNRAFKPEDLRGMRQGRPLGRCISLLIWMVRLLSVSSSFSEAGSSSDRERKLTYALCPDYGRGHGILGGEAGVYAPSRWPVSVYHCQVTLSILGSLPYR
jgi:hypothetical protein